MMDLPGFLIISASFAVSLLVLAPGVSSSGEHLTSTCCKDGYGLNYTLPTRPCRLVEVSDEATGSRLVQTIPKLIPPSRFEDDTCGRESRIGIPRGHRICRVPDCESNPCVSGWCEETMTSYGCHCPPGITGRNCDEEKALELTESPTTQPSTQITTSTLTSASAPSSGPTSGTTTDMTTSPTSTLPTTTRSWSQQIRPLAFFKFESDVTDSSGFAPDSNVSVSGSLTYAAGICGEAAVFDGNTKVTVQSFNGYAWGMHLSVSVWFKRTGQTSMWQSIVNNGYYSYGSWRIFVRNGQALLSIAAANVQKLFYHNSIGTGADWNHIVMTYDGNQTIAYLNGGNKVTNYVGYNREINTVQTSVTIGQAGAGYSGFFFHGLIDEVRIYNHTLSESQVFDLYNTSRCT